MLGLNSPTKLLLAFDVGTIYSTISYCILEPHQLPEALEVARFPEQGVAGADAKVPSLLYYDRCGAVRAAGAEALTEDVIQTAQTEGWTKAECWKLHLRPKHLASSIDDLHPLPSGKSAVDVLTDFIKYLFDCSKDYIQESHPTLCWSSVEDSIEYILTYPGGWSEQQHLYYEAIERAGLVPRTPGSQLRVHMLTEGEATLHFYILCFLNSETANQTCPQGIAIINAGGGIIDVNMFLVTPNRMSCDEVTAAECRLQGSVFVTRRARGLMEGKLEGWEHTSAENITRFTHEFDQTTKLVIETDQRPAYVKVAGRRTNSPRHHISSGQLKLTGKEATGLFDESIDAIISAFQLQLKAARIPITTAFLVGGLSRNDWVWSRLQSYFMDKNINIFRLGSHVAVAKGAVLYASTTRSVYALSSPPNTFLSRKDSPLARLYSSRSASFCAIHENDVGAGYATYSADYALPVKAIDREYNSRSITIRRRLSRLTTRVHVLAKKCNLREWLLTSERSPARVSWQILRIMCCQGSLSDPKWIYPDGTFY